MKRIIPLSFLLLLLLAACAPAAPSQEAVSRPDASTVTVYRAPTWGCCGDWIAYMEDNGFSVQVEDVDDLNRIKDEKQVPPLLRSCHTAVVDGYIIEGHVSVAEIERLLDERPDIAGLAVPGMPPGSPGMEVASGQVAAYDVIAFDKEGNSEVYASYEQ